MRDWASCLSELLARGEEAALVTVLATEGSTPRDAGTRMIVTANAAHGTIGGGNLEYRATEQARAILGLPPGAWRVQDYPLGPLLGQCCGGRVRLLVEHVDPAALDWLSEAKDDRTLVTQLMPARVDRMVTDAPLPPASVPARGALPAEGSRYVERIGAFRRPLLLFGAGHVGQAIARAAGALPFSLAWFDTRCEAEAIPGVTRMDETAMIDCATKAAAGAAILILTHDHGLDYRLTAAALSGPADFVGLIGSATKRARFLSRLERDGFDAAARARLTCPIGITGISGKQPEVIAVSVLAQLLTLAGDAA